MAPRRILVAKLATLGDLLVATPALRALRLTLSSAVALDDNDAVDRVIPFDKFSFDRVGEAPRALPGALGLARALRRQRFDALVLLHHLTTRWGTAKYAALALRSGAPLRLGL